MSLQLLCQRIVRWTALGCASIYWQSGCAMLADHSSTTNDTCLVRHDPVSSSSLSEPISSDPTNQPPVQEVVAAAEHLSTPCEVPRYHSALRGQQPGSVVVRYNPRTGITHTHRSEGTEAASMPSPYQKTFAPLKAEEVGAPSHQDDSAFQGHQTGAVVVRYNPRTGITHTHRPGSTVAATMPSPYQRNFVRLTSATSWSSAPSISAPADPKTSDGGAPDLLRATIYAPHASDTARARCRTVSDGEAPATDPAINGLSTTEHHISATSGPIVANADYNNLEATAREQAEDPEVVTILYID